MSSSRGTDEERRKLFRRMEWVFVYAPPLLALFIAAFGGLFLATFVPIPGTNLLGRWLLAVLFILVIPTILYLLQATLRK